jgi:hypothetical protein
MKKLLFILLTTFLSGGIYSQGNNLQFSQVINLSYEQLNSTYKTMMSQGTITVPSNKVWKISAASGYGERPSDGLFLDHWGDIFIDKIRLTSSYDNYVLSNVPYWLNSGTYTVYLYSKENNYSVYGTLSIVEFNIVQ